MPGMRSLRNRLAVIFALIILGAIGTIYLSVTPRLEDSLTTQRLDQVRAAASSCRRSSAATCRRAKDPPLIKARQAGRHEDQGAADANIRRFAERFNTELHRDGGQARPVPTCSPTRRRTAAPPHLTSRT